MRFIREKAKFIIPAVMTLFVLSFLFFKVDYREVWKIFVQSNKLFLLVAALVFLLPSLISAFRWKTLMKLAGCDIAYKTVLSIHLASVPIAKLSPSNSGDLTRAVYLKDQIPITKNIGIILFENMSNLSIVSLLALLGGLILKIKLAILIGAIILLMNLVFFIFIPRINLKVKESWKIKLENFGYIFKILLKNPRSLGLVIFYTLLMWLLVLICFKIIFYSFGVNMPFLYIVAAQPIAILFGLIPITFSGVGIRESLMTYLYYNLAPSSSIIAVGLSYSFLVVIFLPLIGLPFLFIKIRDIKILNNIHGNSQ